MNTPHLINLNPEQRRAVEYGGPTYAEAGPLLIIAGAGSGKTNTLAHRVAHLVINGIDPRRIMLLTFTRRAAAEMTRRVERITAKVIGANAGVLMGALTWSGTFHAIGARPAVAFSAGGDGGRLYSAEPSISDPWHLRFHFNRRSPLIL